MIRLVPNPRHAAGHVVSTHGREFRAGDGVIELRDTDLAIETLCCAGWTRLPPHGRTGERPKSGAPGSAFIDDDLGEVVFALVFPIGSGIVVGWCGASGNAV